MKMIEFNDVGQSEIKGINVKHTLRNDEGWHCDIAMRLEVPIATSKDIGAIPEAEMIDAIHREGRQLAEKEGAKTYELKTKRKFPPMDLTIRDKKTVVKVIGQIKEFKTHVVEGNMYVTFTVNTRLEHSKLTDLERLMSSPVRVTTLASQLDLLENKAA